MHPQGVTNWCGFWYGGIIGPFFFENEQVSSVTVNDKRYRAMLNEFLFPKIEEVAWKTVGFNKTGHLQYSQRNNRSLAHHFRKSNNHLKFWCQWPPRSSDLTQLDYFLWGAVEDKYYANHPETIKALKHGIQVAIHGIEAQTIENVLKNCVDRVRYCKASRGSHSNDVVFHS